MEEKFVKDLAKDFFDSIERDNPEVFAKTQKAISNEYANNEVRLMAVVLKRLKKSKTITSAKTMKKLEIIERELLNIADDLEIKIKM